MTYIPVAHANMSRRAELVKKSIQKERPDLLDLFNSYANEASTARTLIDKNLNELKLGSKILEIGGGILALATQLASEGYKINVVEPVSSGFSGISFIMNKYLEIADAEGSTFNLVQSPIEECRFDEKFDFIFSINVMEHLKNPYITLNQVVNLLDQNAIYRLTCPNYDFPYEPHFGKILFTRKNLSFFLPIKRARSKRIATSEIQGIYESLNFITIRKIIRKCKDMGFHFKINDQSFYEILVRSLNDTILGNRHKRFVCLVRVFKFLRVIQFFKLFPPLYSPVCDIEIKKASVF